MERRCGLKKQGKKQDSKKKTIHWFEKACGKMHRDVLVHTNKPRDRERVPLSLSFVIVGLRGGVAAAERSRFWFCC